MASLPGDYTSQASCPGHDYYCATLAWQLFDIVSNEDFSRIKWGWNPQKNSLVL